MGRWASGLAVAGCAAAVAALALPWRDLLGPRLNDACLARLADPATRAAEARRLGQAGWPEAVPHVAKLSRGDAPADRIAAVWALGRIGGPRAAAAVVATVRDEDPNVRREAARALGRLRAPLQEEGLGLLLADPVASVRVEAVRALPDGSTEAAVGEALAKAAADGAATVRAAVVEEAPRQPPETAWRALASAMRDEETEVARAASEQIRSRRQELAPLALRQCRTAKEADDLLAVGRILHEVADVGMAPAMLDLLDAAGGRRRQPSVELTELVVGTLAAMGPAVAPTLVPETIHEERSAAAEAAAADAMRRIGPAAGTELTRGLLAWRVYPDPEELKRWVEVLGAIGDGSSDTSTALERAAGQAIAGMDTVVDKARRVIVARTGRPMAPTRPQEGLIAGAPAEAAWEMIGGGPINVTGDEKPAKSLPDDGVVHIRLAGGITWSDRPDHSGSHDLLLVLRRRGGQWVESFVAYAARFNKRTHVGKIKQADNEAPGSLHVELLLNSDLWKHAAFAEYTIGLKRGDDGTLTATFRGMCNEEPNHGDATVSAWPARWGDNGAAPLQPQEHPRLLFRRHHVAQLRERTKTPVGRAIFQAMMALMQRRRMLYRTKLDCVTNWEAGADQAIGHGFLARVFGDARHGARAVRLILPRTLQRPYQGEHGERLPPPMIRYPFAADLMFDEYTPDQRAQVLGSAGHMRLAFSCTWGPVGVYAANRSVVSVPALNALMLLDEPGRAGGPRPKGPPPPVEALEPEQPPHAPDVLEPFAPNRLVTHWLWAGRIAPGSDDPLADIGGRTGAWIREGQSFSYGGATHRFARLDASAVQTLANLKTAKYLFPPGDADQRCLLYTVLDVKAPTCIVVPDRQFGHPTSVLFLHGQPHEPGTIVLLRPGRHRMLLEMVGKVANVRFPGIRAGYIAALRRKQEWLQSEYEAARARGKKTGRVQDMHYILEMASHVCRTSLLTGAARVRRNGRRGGEFIWPLVAARWLCTGQGLSPDTPWAPALRRDPAVVRQMSDRELCFMMGMGPDTLRAAMAAEFRRRYLAPDGFRRLGCLELVAALVHYPMDLERP